MSWPTVIWSMVAAACITMAMPHLIIGIWRRGARAHLLFALLGFAVAWMAVAELSIMRAVTTRESGRALQIAQVSTFLVVVAIVGLVQVYFGTGRLWLGVLACGLRAVCLVANFADPPNMNFREVTALRTYQFLGETVTMPLGPRNPWLLLAYTSSLLVLAFVIDASRKLWRQGTPEHRRRAVVAGGTMVVFIIVAQGMAVLTNAGAINFPISASIPLMVIVGAMGFELSHDVLRAAEVSVELRESERRMALAADATGFGFWVWEIPSDEVWITDPGRAHFGLEPGERLNYASFAATFHPDDRESVRSAIEAAIASGGDYDIEYRVLSLDGPLRWIAARGQVEYGKDGKPLRMRGVTIDITERKHAEEALRENAQRMSLAMDAANFGIWIRDLTRNEIWASNRWRALLGFDATEKLSLDSFFQRLHPEDREPTRHALSLEVAADGSYERDYRVMLSDGQVRWIASHGRAEFDGNGKPVLVRGVSMDITERKRVEEALRESEARFRIVADTAPVMLWMSGTDKLCNFFNKGWHDFTGRAPEQELGNGWAEGVHPDDLERCLNTYTIAFDAREPFTMEYRLRKHDGEYGWVLDTGVPRMAGNGEFLGYIGSAIDITTQKQAEERFRLVVEATPNAKVMVNSEGVIVLVNAQTEAVFGYTRAELIGKSIEELVPERSRAHHSIDRHDYVAHPATRAMGAEQELFGRRKDGSEVPVEIGLNPIRTPEGLFVLASIVDITERKQAELEAVRLRAELEHLARVSMLGELSGSLAHELNQPLTSILSNAEAAANYLAEEAPDLAQVRDILADIAAEDERAGQVIRRLRLLLKKGQVQFQSLDANELVSEVLKLTRSDLAINRVTVETALGLDLPAIRGDSVQLQQVLMNLVMNACDAMANIDANDRRLTVRTSSVGEDGVRIEVIDAGHGLPEGGAEQAFERYFTTKPHGLGLGLSVCGTILTAHGGALGAANNPERGATFYCTLPLAKETRA